MQHFLKLGAEGNLPMNALLRSEKEFKLRCRPSILQVGRNSNSTWLSTRWWTSYLNRNCVERLIAKGLNLSPEVMERLECDELILIKILRIWTSSRSRIRISPILPLLSLLWINKRLYNLLCSFCGFEIRPNKLDRYIWDSGVEHLPHWILKTVKKFAAKPRIFLKL